METASRSADAKSGAAQNLPSAEEFQAIYTKMAEAVLLAETFSPPAVSRGDETGGLFAESYRGYVVKEVPVPVQFQFDSVRFTAKGEQVAAYLLDYLVSSNLPKIKLIGHTDPVGSDDFNEGLSLSSCRSGEGLSRSRADITATSRSKVTANRSRSSRSTRSTTTTRRSTSSIAASSSFAIRIIEMRFRGFRRTALVGLAASSLLDIAVADRAAAEVHALVVGINDYTGGPPKLKGAVNDANDIAAVLRASGVA